MNKKVLSVIDHTLSVFKYFLGISMMFSGVVNAIGPTAKVAGPVGFIYGSSFILFLIGLFFFTAGFLLFVGKLTKRTKWVGYGLMMTYLSFLFSAILQFLSGLDWVFYIVMALIVGVLYLRWKYQKFYLHPANRNRLLRKHDDKQDRNGESTV